MRREPRAVLEVLVAARGGKRRSEIEGLCRRHGITIRSVSPASLDEGASRAVHNGFAARHRDRGVGTAKALGDDQLRVLVEDVQDPRNLGALIRVCEGAGVGHLLVRDRGSSPLTPAAAKTSAGASEWLPLERIVNSAQQIEALKAEGYWVYGADAAGDPPWEVDLTGPVLLCLGGEQKGLRSRTRSLCDRLIGLPMRGRVESLNLATAASALLYEALRQRLTASTGAAG